MNKPTRKGEYVYVKDMGAIRSEQGFRTGYVLEYDKKKDECGVLIPGFGAGILVFKSENLIVLGDNLCAPRIEETALMMLDALKDCREALRRAGAAEEIKIVDAAIKHAET